MLIRKTRSAVFLMMVHSSFARTAMVAMILVVVGLVQCTPHVSTQIAKLDVKLNELNESLHMCVQRNDYEGAKGVHAELAPLGEERAELLRLLHGGDSLRSVPKQQ